MFGRMMNNYYYGKSGKGDFRKEDLPENRWQLFWETLRTRLSGLFRMNLMYMVVWLPAMIVLLSNFMNIVGNTNTILAAKDGSLKTIVEETAGQENAVTYTDEQITQIASINASDYVNSVIFQTLLWLIPCIAITGPFTAGITYVTRNWARDEHAFIWTDFKDAVKENWKKSLVISLITSVLPVVVYISWRFYGQLAAEQTFMFIPQILVVMIGVIWAICVTYSHPLIVSYDLKMKGVLRNSLLLGIARLPMSVGIRLLHCVPTLICFLICFFWQPIYGAMILFGYYMLIGFSLSRFITASYTNAVFDKYINSRIEGAQVNRGLKSEEDMDDEEDDSEESRPEEAGGNQKITE